MKKSDRQKIFDMTVGRCAYCGCDLGRGWHVDHVKALGRNSRYDKEKRKFVHDGTCNFPENDHQDNYLPSCPSCNITKSGASVEDFRGYIGRTIDIMNQKHYAAYRFAKKFGLINETPKPIVFYFETIDSTKTE